MNKILATSSRIFKYYSSQTRINIKGKRTIKITMKIIVLSLKKMKIIVLLRSFIDVYLLNSFCCKNYIRNLKNLSCNFLRMNQC